MYADAIAQIQQLKDSPNGVIWDITLHHYRDQPFGPDPNAIDYDAPPVPA